MLVLVFLTLALQQSPKEQAELLNLQAQEQRKLGHTAQAVELHRQAMDLQPESRSIRNEFARSLLADSSAAEVMDLLTAHLKDIETVKLYAAACLEMNKAAKAIPHLQAFAAQDRDGSIHLLLGKAYQQLHQPTPAGLALRKAEQLRSAAAGNLKPN